MLGKDWRDGEHQRWLAAHEDTAARAAVEGVGLCGMAGHPTRYVEVVDAYGSVTKIPHVLQDPYLLPGRLDSLPTDGFIYLGSPYSLQADLDEAARLVSLAAAHLMNRGLVVFAPISHGHTIAGEFSLPSDWPFWKRQCEPLIAAASALVVLKLDGWRDSVGLTYEIARFHEAGKPIVYVTMEDLAA